MTHSNHQPSPVQAPIILHLLHLLQAPGPFPCLGNHPKLLAESRCPSTVQKDLEGCEAGRRGSGKIERLLELLEEILDAGAVESAVGWWCFLPRNGCDFLVISW